MRTPTVPPQIQPKPGQAGSEKVNPDGTPVGDERGFLQKYWWAILLGVVLLTSGGGGEEEGDKGKTGGAAGSGAAAKKTN